MTRVAVRKVSGVPDAMLASPAIAIGTVLDGKYRVESVIGRGGMADVVAAKHEKMGHRVAVKVLRRQTACEALFPRVLREARAAAGLTSEHVTRVLDIGSLESGEPYLVMELLDGIDFGELLRRRGQLTVCDAATYLVQACDALGEAHALGIVHRDLKPSNLFLARRRGGTPLVKLMDFGISKLAEHGAAESAAEPLTAARDVLGTPHYMSPEQILSPRDVDARTDIWALGVLLYRLLTLRYAFGGETSAAIFISVASAPAPKLREVCPDAPPELEQLVLDCLEKAPAQRLPSAAAFARAILPFSDDETQRRYAHVGVGGAPVVISDTATTRRDDATFMDPLPEHVVRPTPSVSIPHSISISPSFSLPNEVASHKPGQARLKRVAILAVAAATVPIGILAARASATARQGTTVQLLALPETPAAATLPSSLLHDPIVETEPITSMASMAAAGSPYLPNALPPHAGLSTPPASSAARPATPARWPGPRGPASSQGSRSVGARTPGINALELPYDLSSGQNGKSPRP
jgi:serine/threonine-protein kinase